MFIIIHNKKYKKIILFFIERFTRLCDIWRMENDKTHVRRTISISPYIDETIEVLSRSEFGGNASAFTAHSILHYIRCQRCALNNFENDSDNASNMPVQGKSLPRPH